MKGTVTVVGSYNVGLFTKGDRLPGVGETVIGNRFWEGPGGKGSNQAIAAAKLGARTNIVARIGNDDYAKDALELYRRCGISTGRILVDPDTHTGISSIFIDKDGLNLIMVAPGANFRLTPEDVDAAAAEIRSSSIVGFQLENRLELVDYGLRTTHAMGVATLLDPAPAVPLPESLYPSITYIKPNETEATLLTGIPVHDVATAGAAGRWLVARGVETAVVTLGEQGAVLVTEKRMDHFPAHPVKAEDSTGAGDIFSGAFMAALANGQAIDDAMVFATQAAALSVTRFGVVEAIPELWEVLQAMEAASLAGAGVTR